MLRRLGPLCITPFFLLTVRCLFLSWPVTTLLPFLLANVTFFILLAGSSASGSSFASAAMVISPAPDHTHTPWDLSLVCALNC
jgi:hypothetical protein